MGYHFLSVADFCSKRKGMNHQPMGHSLPDNNQTLSSPSSNRGSKPSKGRFAFTRVMRRWWWLGLMVIVLLSGGAAQLPHWLGVRGPLYESTALVEVMPIRDVDAPDRWVDPGPRHSVSSTPQGGLDHRFLATQQEIIKTPKVMREALSKHDLLNLLGNDEDVALAHLEKMIRVSVRRGTDLIELSCRDEDSQIAYTAAISMVEAYEEVRKARELKVRKEALKVIKEELQNKSDRVVELRKRVMDIAEKSGISYMETGREDQVKQPSKSKVNERVGEGHSQANSQKNRRVARDIQEFKITRKDDQTALELKDNLELRYDLEKVKLILPSTQLIVHQLPEQSHDPVTKGGDFYRTLLAALSLPFSILAAILTVYVAESIFPRKSVDMSA